MGRPGPRASTKAPKKSAAARSRRGGRAATSSGAPSAREPGAGSLYETLGVSPKAGEAELQRAYQKLARLLHPDLNPGDEVAARRYREAQRAFEVVRDPERRAAYDRGEPLPEAQPRAPSVGFEGFDFNADPDSEAGFGEIFATPTSTSPAGGAEPGEELEHATRISFAESMQGTHRRIHLVRYDACPGCRGRGEVSIEPARCPACEGSGRRRTSRGHMVFSRDCARCNGSGSVRSRPCARCQSEGRLMRSEWLEIEIPPGVGHRSRVRLAGCGNVGRRGGEPGDFVLVVDVEPDSLFRREQDDLHCTVPLTMMEAALGTHVEVPTPEGSVQIEVPAGTQPGHRFRLRKRGVPRLDGSGRGDLYVETSLWVPTVADGRGRELLEELARLHDHDPRRELGARPPAITEE